MDPHLEEYYEEVHAAREVIKAGADLCLKKFQELIKAQKPERTNYRTEFQEVFKIIGRTLFNAAEPFLEEKWGQREFNFYYWPGYESVLTDDPSDKRITLMWDKSPDGEIRCGAGYRLTSDSVDRDYPESGSSLWFERALTVCPEDRGGKHFIPGGTHGWVSQDNLLLDTERRRDSLTALEVRVSDRNACELKRGIVHIQLSADDYSHWGTTVARYLNDRDLIICNKDWPVPLEGDSDGESRRDQYIRRKLYNVWLAATFDIDWRGEWLDDFLRQLERRGLSRLSERLRKDASEREYVKPPPYRWWYTLRLDNSVESDGTLQPLGSAMFLSSAKLPPVYLYIAASFINRMYFQMRDLERATKLTQEAGIAGQKRQARIFSHQTAGLITVPWNDPGRTHLEEESQYLLWMAVTLVTQIWGTTNFKPRQPISSDAEFRDWKELKTIDILDKVISFALLQGLQRASKAPTPKDDPASWRLNWQAVEIARDLLQQRSSRIASLRERLGLQLSSALPKDWMICKGFILCFHHGLWQATHHAFKASLDGSHECYLWIEWDHTSLTIWNRSSVVNGSKKKSSDREFLDFLETRLDNVFFIDGPKEVEDEQSKEKSKLWRTTITYMGG
ncbi:MAG TPA: hypothetical protein VF538_16980 [Pyrinomonadaceae bacterium]|jgi:hypothetical protein